MSLWESKLLDSLTFCVLILKLVVSYAMVLGGGGVDLLFYLFVIHKSKTADSLQKNPRAPLEHVCFQNICPLTQAGAGADSSVTSELGMVFCSCLAWTSGMRCAALPRRLLQTQSQPVLHPLWPRAWRELCVPVPACPDAWLGAAGAGLAVLRGGMACLFGICQETTHLPKQIPPHSHSELG